MTVKPACAVLTAVLFATAGAKAQLLEPLPRPVLQLAPSAMRSVPTFPSFYTGNQGLPPADPLALDIYRPDLKLYAGVDFHPRFGIEMTYTNRDYTEGMHFRGFGPRKADSIPLFVGGFNLDVAARASAPVDDRLTVFGTLGVSAIVRDRVKLAPAASVGATYKLNSRQTATAEIPFGSQAIKAITGKAGALGGSVKLGF